MSDLAMPHQTNRTETGEDDLRLRLLLGEPQSDSCALEPLRAEVFGALFDVPPRRFGRYIERGVLGRGGMGVVLECYDDELDRPVAVKKLVEPDPTGRHGARLKREAQALAKLAHPNVVQVYEVGEEEGQLFVAMEMVKGRTLRQWQSEGSSPRPWTQCVEIYLHAGRGLAAAHARGLVHRDFKPGNAIVDEEGRTRVLDFGLVRRADEAGHETSSGLLRTRTSEENAAAQRESLTMTGTVLGTPAYMPPEQMEGRDVDARGDQFSFCVSFYEALHGERPYAGSSLAALMMSMRTGEVRQAPAGSDVPVALRKVLLRGLAFDPERRWPSMEALLDGIVRIVERHRRRRRRAFVGVALVLVASAAGLAGTMWRIGTSQRASCENVEAQLDGVWDESTHRTLREVFEAKGQPAASEIWGRVEGRLDAWGADWIAEQRANCSATQIQGTQSEAMLDRRSVCLHRHSGETKALVDALTMPDVNVVARAGQVLAELPDLGACSIEAMSSSSRHVVKPSDSGDVEAGYEVLAQARAQLAVGRPQEAVELAEGARDVGDRVAHAPLSLEARAVLAKVTSGGGKLADGLEALRRVVLDAERAELFDLAATLRVQMARDAAGDLAEPRLERWLIDEAQLALERVSRPLDPREVTLQSARARIAEQAGDFSTAIAAHERAHTLAEGRLEEGARAMLRVGVGTAMYRNGDYKGSRRELLEVQQRVRDAWGSRAPELARIDFNLGMIEVDLGHPRRAMQYLTSAIAIDEAVWGAESIEAARDRFALAYLAFETGDLARSCELIAQVLEVYEAELGAEHDETASAIDANASCLYHAGDLAGAAAGFRRALTVQRRLLGDAHHQVGLLHANLGMAQLGLGQLDDALASQERAREILLAALPAEHPQQAAHLTGRALVWLATGQEASAIEDLERALALATQVMSRAEAQFGLARALLAVHGDRQSVLAADLAQQALEGFSQAGVEHRMQAVQVWIDESIE